MRAPLGLSAGYAFLRSLLIQGSWNYHTMLGTGFAFAILPGLRRLFRDDPSELDAAVRRHVEHFNAHPYLADVALGATLRLEADGADPEMVRRFKFAVRGPLGSLGDALVWATWLPGVSLAALTLFWLGAPAWVVVAVFLTVYNIGHVALRAWGFRAGLLEGREVGRRLGEADLAGWTVRLRPAVAVALGLLTGSALASPQGLSAAGPLWAVLAAAGFAVGLWVGHRAWRPAAAAIVLFIGVATGVGVLR